MAPLVGGCVAETSAIGEASPSSNEESAPSAATANDGTLATCGERPACDASLPPSLLKKGQFYSSESGRLSRFGHPQHRGRDLFLREGDEAWALGKFAYAPLNVKPVDKDLKGEDVWVYLLKGCGSDWTYVGTARTTQDGEHETVEGVEDTGGRVYLSLKQAGLDPLPVGRHKIVMVVAGDGSSTEQFIEVLPRDAKIAVSDVDGTLTSSEMASASDLIGRPAQAHPGAPEVMRALAQQGYYLFYLTARPEWMTSYSRAWFPLRGFPPGIIHTTLTLTGAVGKDASNFKKAELEALKSRLGIVPTFAFGNKPSDVVAYGESAIETDHCFYFGLGASAVNGGHAHDDYRTLIPVAEAAPKVCR